MALWRACIACPLRALNSLGPVAGRVPLPSGSFSLHVLCCSTNLLPPPLFQGVCIKAWLNDHLQYKRKFLKISETDTASVHPAGSVVKISIEVENGVYDQSSKAN